MENLSTFRILALDDHPIVLEGITHVLNGLPGIQCQGLTTVARLQALLKQKKETFDLFILDLEFPDSDGFEVLKSIRIHCPDTAIIIYTMHEEPWILARLSQLDIQGVVPKSHPVSELADAVSAIRQGRNYFNKDFLRQLRLVQTRKKPIDSSPAFNLTERERQVLHFISRGMTTSQIAREIFISENTVGTYRHRLMQKFSAHNVAQLIAAARKYLK